MVFVDTARIFIKAGGGGKGCESFFLDRRMRHPRPDGGDGGRGGDVIFVADRSIQTLLDFKFKQHYKGQRGGHASSKKKKGKDGKDCRLRVPLGTIIKEAQEGLIIKDLVEEGQSVIVARGGRRGIGNAQKKIPLPPGEGEERTIYLELKVIADVGLIGFPNAGKSTLISTISKVKSKIAEYPFTTKQPILGIVFVNDFKEGFEEFEEEQNFVVADLPGIIEGAHSGRGLGDQFLRHAERTKILVHVIDMAAVEGRDPLEDYAKISYELQEYSEKLNSKNRIIVANKMDVPQAAQNLKRFKQKYKEEIIPVSGLEKKGLKELVDSISEVLCQENSQDQ
ncbi:GTP-binding protein Obg [hydrothermal vent metagenome]|uniref:GTP-binding protein Obg n=1 Tax=hydrothermal vent metagenome TaxID=652676 RepID=A0A3B1E4U0_9ZZZZ